MPSGDDSHQLHKDVNYNREVIFTHYRHIASKYEDDISNNIKKKEKRVNFDVANNYLLPNNTFFLKKKWQVIS